MASTEDVNSLLSGLQRMCAINTDDPEPKTDTPQYSQNLQNRLAAIKELAAAEEKKKLVDPKIIAAQQKLPIFKRKTELLEALEENQVLIVIGDTGSGKTTQLPQYLKEMGLAVKGRIGCTQLRRMAARAVARRVAREQGCKVGEEVGYTVRFDDCTGPNTQIQYMTDGILLRECTYDRTLSSYSAIILDESHERTVDTDILLGILRWILAQRNDLKLIISSATLDKDKFSSYFYDAKVFVVSGRMFPVEEIYVPSDLPYVSEAVKQVIRINEREGPGDIMVFMSGEFDIEEMKELLEDYRSSLYSQLIILPCYSALPAEDQAKIFEPAELGKRKVIIATNIAETSLTVDGIRYVIDAGWVKQKVYDNRKECEILRRIRVSQAQAIQRSGRAGRVAPGKCYRLYSKQEFDMFVSGPEPEIKRSSLTSAVLLLKKMGFKDLKVFNFIDKPSEELLQEAEDELIFFQAVNTEGEITELGKKMASFPLEPNLCKMLVISEEQNCSEEVLTIVALLSVANIFIRPRKKQKQADAAKAKFFTNDGDLMTMLKVYNEWISYDRDPDWCRENFIHHRLLKEVFKIREQLKETMIMRGMKIRSPGSSTQPILKSICSGLIKNLAHKTYRIKHAYQTLPKQSIVYIHPGSAVFRTVPTWVVYQKVVETQKAYMRGVTPVDPIWIQEYAPAFALL